MSISLSLSLSCFIFQSHVVVYRKLYEDSIALEKRSESTRDFDVVLFGFGLPESQVKIFKTWLLKLLEFPLWSDSDGVKPGVPDAFDGDDYEEREQLLRSTLLDEAHRKDTPAWFMNFSRASLQGSNVISARVYRDKITKAEARAYFTRNCPASASWLLIIGTEKTVSIIGGG